ncbi:MAG TPA: hypothetical protein VNM87_12120 [Candidatus Udaeobacter sp.]|nr:hypothetical protein [Candidatus Udaeobacter sp.]
MTRSVHSLGLVAVVLGLTGLAAAPRAAELDRQRFIPVDEIHAGMTGTGRTTFSPRGVEEFSVQVIGVLHGWVPGGDLIVIEASGGPLAETGIFRGMSGSPVYFNGRLAGAVSYNLGGFGERPIAGVTPIAEMLPIAAGAGESRPPNDDPSTMPPPKKAALPGERSTGDVQPIRTPLILAGFAPGAREAMATLLAGYGLEVVSGGASGGGGATPSGTLVPGAPLGVQIVRGDVEATALGTVTHVDGNAVLAFGHPMFLGGPVDLPMTTAQVFTVYPSQEISFVVGAAAQPVGRIVADQMTGIAGHLGESAPMVPLKIRVRRPSGHERTFNFEIVDNRFFLGQFLGLLAFNCFTSEEKAFGDATLDLHLKVDLKSGEQLDVHDVLSTTLPPNELAAKVSEPLSGLLFNPLEPARVRAIDLDLEVTPEIRTAEVEELIVDQSTIEPGQSIAATVYLRPYRADRIAIPIVVPVPKDAFAGPMLLRVCSVEETTRWESERAPRRFVPSSLAQLVELYEETSGHDLLRVTLYGDARGVVVEGREMPGLPGSVFSIMDSERRSGGRSGSWGRLLYDDGVRTSYQLSGCEELRLETKAPFRPAQEKNR